MRYLLTMSYDGTCYSGWQRQDNAVTVQEKTEGALKALFRQDIRTTAASRTDAGVHALGQRVSFDLENCKIPTDRIALVLNSYLPEDIAVTAAETVDDHFNPRFRAKEKTYHYQIWHDKYPNPLIRHTCVFFPYPLEVDLMKESAGMFMGRHDFAAFCASGSAAMTTVREIYQCSVQTDGYMITISVRGNAFLYNMVRIMAGTLVLAGQRKIPASDIPDIIISHDRARAGPTMPARGLTLIRIKY